MASGLGIRVRVLIVPLKFTCMMANFVALLMCWDTVEDNVLASLRPGYRTSIYDDTSRSAKVAVGLGLLFVLFCLIALMVGYSTLHHSAAILQVPLHCAAAYLYFTIHYSKLHYMYLWYVFFFLCLPAAVLEIGLILVMRNAKKISW